MQFDKFKAMLEETLDSVESYVCTLADTSSVKNLISDISEYGSRIRDDVTDMFQQFNADAQYQCAAAFDEFMNKCNTLIDESVERLRNHEIVTALSNDLFYNDAALVKAE